MYTCVFYGNLMLSAPTAKPIKVVYLSSRTCSHCHSVETGTVIGNRIGTFIEEIRTIYDNCPLYPLLAAIWEIHTETPISEIELQVDTELAEYRYYLPGKKRFFQVNTKLTPARTFISRTVWRTGQKCEQKPDLNLIYVVPPGWRKVPRWH